MNYFIGQGDVPMVIAANKCDFEPGKRKFSEDAVVNLAQELGCRYFFTSALQDKNVDQVSSIFFVLEKNFKKYFQTFTSVVRLARDYLASQRSSKSRNKKKKDKCSIM